MKKKIIDKLYEADIIKFISLLLVSIPIIFIILGIIITLLGIE